MTASRPLPDRPSLESLRKQAKKLARDIAARRLSPVELVETYLARIERDRGNVDHGEPEDGIQVAVHRGRPSRSFA